MKPISRLLPFRSFAAFLIVGFLSSARAGQYDLPNPAGGDSVFGWDVTVLPNGNFVVTDPSHSAPGPVPAVGAVYLYDGVTLEIISTLTGSTALDQIGSGGVTGLENGNFVVSSPNWTNGAVTWAGAVTWGSATTGVNGVVSEANSLVGGTASDRVGSVAALANGNYLVTSAAWDNGAVENVGAVTWGNGVTGIAGPVSDANSLVGSTANDSVGSGRLPSGEGGVTALSNGNYVVTSPSWTDGGAGIFGAVTWGNGTTGLTGPVSTANSLVGRGRVTALTNGNYVVRNTGWGDGAGAVTWANGTTGLTGIVSEANSLVGSKAGDEVGFDVTALVNGNYVVSSPFWDNGAVANAGAVTWGSGATGTIGLVTAANSLVGSSEEDLVGWIFQFNGVTALANGHYVVTSIDWDNGEVANAGAVTWGNGTTGVTGPVSPANSLVGSSANDGIGNGNGQRGATALANGNFVVSSQSWSDGALASVGAVTWGNGTTGLTGPVTTANSLIGGTAQDHVGEAVTALANGNYVVSSPDWDNGALANVGAATWGDGSAALTGRVSAANSLVGSSNYDAIGSLGPGQSGVVSLANGNYAVSSPSWDHGPLANVGAVTWGHGTTGVTGPISEVNSLVGDKPGDEVGSGSTGVPRKPGVTALADGHYVVSSPRWGENNSGAVSLGDGTVGTTGTILAANSVLGTGQSRVFDYDLSNSRLLVGNFQEERVSLFGYDPEIRIEHPLGVVLPHGGSMMFGSPVGGEDTRTFTVRNTGLGALTGLDITIEGSSASLFTVTSSPATTVSGPLGSTNFAVRFAPATMGVHNAILRLANNDADEHPFVINLLGQALVADQDTDGDGLNDASEIELAALGFDWRVSQPGLVETFFDNANVAGLYTTGQVQALHLDAPLIQRDSASGLFTLTIGVEKSTDLMDFIPFPMSEPQTTINGQGKLEFEFSVTDNAAFFRLEAE